MKTSLLTVLLSALLFGCAKPASTPQGNVVSGLTGSTIPSPDTKTFTCGDATILVGMTKAQVIDQIAKSGQLTWNGEYGITSPSEEMQALDTWVLYYGNPSGAAPGGAGITFIFENGTLIKIIIGHAFA